jgi:hypothetical protein
MATLHFRPGFTGFPTIPKRWKWQENAANWSRNCNFQEEKTCLALPVENLRPVRGWIPAKICWLLKYILYIILYIYLIISYIYIIVCSKKNQKPSKSDAYYWCSIIHFSPLKLYFAPGLIRPGGWAGRNRVRQKMPGKTSIYRTSFYCVLVHYRNNIEMLVNNQSWNNMIRMDSCNYNNIL